MGNLASLKKLTDSIQVSSDKMPLFFIGHGSPMNGIEDNDFSQSWKAIGNNIALPKAIVVVSAHWLTNGTYVTAMDHPRTIHDFGGFPKALYDVEYPAVGSPELAAQMKELVKKTDIGLDHDWGLDHGTWSVLRHIFPSTDIPILQLSIDYHRPALYHYELAKELKTLRNKGVLIIGSGNMVHNLRMVDWDRLNDINYGFDWANESNEAFKKYILNTQHDLLIKYQDLGTAATLSIPSPDHYFPLIYTLGMQDKHDEITFFNDNLVGGSLSMTSVLFN